MQFLQKFYAPGADDNDIDPNEKKRNEESPENTEEEINDEKPLKTKIQEALQQWSNDDARDIAEDDSTPLRSGL